MTYPRISLVIPVYNRPEMIAECLSSLAPSLDALHEVIVVDDGSTDGVTPQATRAAIAALGDDRVRLLEQTNAGPGAARNTGAAAASGDWLAFLDSDDLWLPWTGAALTAALEQHPDTVGVFLNARPFSDLTEIDPWTEEPLSARHHRNFFALSVVKPRVIRRGAGYFAMRRAVFSGSGGFEASLRGSEDTDLYYRLADAGAFVSLDYPATIARRTGIEESLTQNMAAVFEGLDFLMQGRNTGRYGPQNASLDADLADLMGFWVHVLFRGGWQREAYGLLLRQGVLGILIRHGHVVKAIKLLGMPLLARLRPKNHGIRPRQPS